MYSSVLFMYSILPVVAVFHCFVASFWSLLFGTVFSFEIAIFSYTVPKEIPFMRYNTKCSGENVILGGIVHLVSCFPLNFMLYRGNLDYLSDSVVFSSKRFFVQNSLGICVFAQYAPCNCCFVRYSHFSCPIKLLSSCTVCTGFSLKLQFFYSRLLVLVVAVFVQYVH